MNKKTLTALLITAVIVVGGGVSYALSQNDSESNNKKKASEQSAMMKNEESPKMATVQEDSAMAPDNTGMAMTAGSYTDYDAAKLANAEKSNVVLFFHAPWCPTCKEADKNFTSSGTPDGLTLLKTDYDSSKDLRKKYGVTYQHTFVQIDKDGNLIKKWSSSTSYAEIKTQLQ